MSVAYGFEAPPRVVKDKSKYRIDAENESRRIVSELLNDRTLKDLQPRQLEKLYVTRMSDKLKEENLNSQLNSFKAKEKSSIAREAAAPKKVSTGKESAALYDIKPLPHPNIKVDLQFFLTVRNDFQGEKNNAETLTDHFNPRPPSPAYIPKKTGVNVGTQIEDGDLFNFDLEVEPILRVIVTKTLEQARLEIEEQEEILNMKKYRLEYEKRMQEKSNDEEEIVNKELALIKAKDLFLDDLRKKEKNKLMIQKKVQNMVIAKKYGSTLFKSAMRNLELHGFYQGGFEIERDNELLGWLVDETTKKYNEEEHDLKLIEGGFGEVETSLCLIRKPILDKLGRKKTRKQLKKFNLSKKERKIRVFYEAPLFNSTFFSHYLEKWLEGTLDHFLEEMTLKNQELEGKGLPNGDFLISNGENKGNRENI